MACGVLLKPFGHWKRFRWGRVFSKCNFEKFYISCSQQNWDFTSADKLTSFYQVLIKIFNKAFPLRKLKIKKKKHWVTKGIRASSKNLRGLHTMRKYTLNEAFHQYFINYRKLYRRVIGRAKIMHYNQRIGI